MTASAREERAALELWAAALAPIAGINPVIVPDPTGNPLERLQVNIEPPRLGAEPRRWRRALGEQDPAIIVRNHEVGAGLFPA